MAPGDALTPNLRLVRQLGQGGMGSVWIADHLTLRCQVVVKFMSGELAAHPEAVERFQREAALGAQARSPHVVQTFDSGVTPAGRQYIVMELLEGEDLGARIRREAPIDPALFAGWLKQAAKGLSRAHALGIVHRDIKPENLFLCDEAGDVLIKVLDFGIAKGSAGISGLGGTKTGAVMGTYYYMSPEQTLGAKHLDLRADVWALGVVSYLALTATLPFDGQGIGQLMALINAGEFMLPSQRCPHLSPAIDAWMSTALAVERERRFPSTLEMAKAFDQAVLGAPVVHATSNPAVSMDRTVLAPKVVWREASLPVAEAAQASRGFVASTLAPPSTTSSGLGLTRGSISRNRVVVPVLATALAAASGFGVYRFTPLRRAVSETTTVDAVSPASSANVHSEPARAPLPTPVSPSLFPPTPSVVGGQPTAVKPLAPVAASAAPASVTKGVSPVAAKPTIKPVVTSVPRPGAAKVTQVRPPPAQPPPSSRSASPLNMSLE